MLLNKDKSALVLIDVQEKLTPAVDSHTNLIGRCEWLIRLANQLSIPVVVSEQYRRGLGPTVPSLRQLVPDTAVDKVYFSCYKDKTFASQWHALQKEQAVLIGIETHVCVLQTALDMLQDQVEVFVVVDAVSSRNPLDYQFGLQRMQQAGAQLVTSEMVFFEWVEQAGTPEFKALSSAFMKNQ